MTVNLTTPYPLDRAHSSIQEMHSRMLDILMDTRNAGHTHKPKDVQDVRGFPAVKALDRDGE